MIVLVAHPLQLPCQLLLLHPRQLLLSVHLSSIVLDMLIIALDFVTTVIHAQSTTVVRATSILADIDIALVYFSSNLLQSLVIRNAQLNLVCASRIPMILARALIQKIRICLQHARMVILVQMMCATFATRQLMALRIPRATVSLDGKIRILHIVLNAHSLETIP